MYSATRVQKFRTMCATVDFDKTFLDGGNALPVYFVPAELTAAEEARIVALLRKAVG